MGPAAAFISAIMAVAAASTPTHPSTSSASGGGLIIGLGSTMPLHRKLIRGIGEISIQVGE